ncbi:MAG: molybdopterin-binding protein [Candidatus Brocadia sp.]
MGRGGFFPLGASYPKIYPQESATWRDSIREENDMKISACNILKDKVKAVKHNKVDTEVDLELPRGAEIVSVITKHSAETTKLAEGKEVYAVIKASNVMIMTD